jgi:hypothetical protein
MNLQFEYEKLTGKDAHAKGTGRYTTLSPDYEMWVNEAAKGNIVKYNNVLDPVSESLELTKAKEERDQYRKLWRQSQRLKKELIEKYDLPISEATLD